MTMKKLFFGFLINLALLLGGLVMCILMAQPLFTPSHEVSLVRYSWLGLPIIGAYAFTGLFAAGTMAVLSSLKARKQVMRSGKFAFASLAIGALLGFTINLSNYFFVIEPNDLYKCPPLPGYKKNLLYDYVVDPAMCENRE